MSLTTIGATLPEIASVLFQPHPPFNHLTEALERYQALVEEASGLNLEALAQESDLVLAQGKALTTTWAAHCLRDLLRTHRFIYGIHRAVEDLKATRPHPIQVMYAGTGPYATLLLPLMAHYSPAELQVTLLEINPTSFASMQRVVEGLGLAASVKHWEQVDLLDYSLPTEAPPDLVVTETMQRALDREAQVFIAAHLMQQAPKDTLMIPENIELSLQGARFAPEGPAFYPIVPLLNLNRETLAQWQGAKGELHFPRVAVSREQLAAANGNQVCIGTHIRVYGEVELAPLQSGLTQPKLLFDRDQLPEDKKELVFQYQSHPEPELAWHWE